MYVKEQMVLNGDKRIGVATLGSWWVSDKAWNALAPDKQAEWVSLFDEVHEEIVALAATDFDGLCAMTALVDHRGRPAWRTIMMAAVRQRRSGAPDLALALAAWARVLRGR